MLMRLVLTAIKPYRAAVLGLVVFQVASTIAVLQLPRLNAEIIDIGIRDGDVGFIVRTGGWMLALALLQVVGGVGATYLGARTATAVGRDLRGQLFHRVQSFSVKEVGQFGAPSLITRLTNDVQQVQMVILMTFTLLVMAPVMAVGGIVMALRQSPQLSWIIAVSVAVLVGTIAVVVTRMFPGFKRIQTLTDGINGTLREQITGIRVVRAFVRERSETERFEQTNVDLTDAAIKVQNWGAILFPTAMAAFNMSSAAVLWFGAGLVDRGSIEIGAISAFLTYMLQILMSVMMGTFVLFFAPRAAVCAERIDEVLRVRSTIAPAADPVTAFDPDPTVAGSVEFDAATFCFEGATEPVLADISFTARRGLVTAIIGSTGAGKTTLLNLIPRLLDVTAGTVRVGGVDVRELEPDTLWGAVGYIPQRPFLFSGTIASNLRYGKPEATDDEMWEALRIAQADDFVAALPDGLDAAVAQGGTNFSGGQRQRLTIARALVRRPAFYLFDDSFSALDTGTDARLRAALRPRLHDAAVIIVAQRVSTIVDADEILVLEDGCIVGRGRHDELLASCPTYAEIVDSQALVEESA